MTVVAPSEAGIPGADARPDRRHANAGRTRATLAGLLATLPIDLLLVAVALVCRSPSRDARTPSDTGKTVLINGGKMTKALQLARSFHSAGHRVVLVESAKYRFTGHRFSRAVAAFHCVPEPAAPGYAEALLDVVRRERVDVFVPVSSPAGSVARRSGPAPARRCVRGDPRRHATR